MSDLKPGDVRRWDFQNDIFGGQYKLIRRLEDRTWEIEYMPADEVTQDAILDHWAREEANGRLTSPIWDKTWAECAEGEHPQKIGWKTYEEMLQEDLDRYSERAGQRSTVRIVSAAEFAEYF